MIEESIEPKDKDISKSKFIINTIFICFIIVGILGIVTHIYEIKNPYMPPKSMECKNGYCTIYGEDIQKTGFNKFVTSYFKEVYK